MPFEVARSIEIRGRELQEVGVIHANQASNGEMLFGVFLLAVDREAEEGEVLRPRDNAGVALDVRYCHQRKALCQAIGAIGPE